ncbi:MAG: hypothetical protein HOQ05_12155 [Corynebacteriales bacterium]|nr:hypothetical protein [Mycobacteriales bacterium]
MKPLRQIGAAILGLGFALAVPSVAFANPVSHYEHHVTAGPHGYSIRVLCTYANEYGDTLYYLSEEGEWDDWSWENTTISSTGDPEFCRY